MRPFLGLVLTAGVALATSEARAVVTVQKIPTPGAVSAGDAATFVYIVQNSSQSSNAPIPVDCGMDRPRLYNVQVSAGPAPFEQGEAVATAYVLLQDTSSGSTIPLNDTATIIIRPVTGKTAPSER